MLAALRWLLLTAVLALSVIAPTMGRFGLTATDLVLLFAAYSAGLAVVQRRAGWAATSAGVITAAAAVTLSLIGLRGSVQCPLYFLSPLVIVPLLLALPTPAALGATLALTAAVSALTVTHPDWDGTPAALQIVAFQGVRLVIDGANTLSVGALFPERVPAFLSALTNEPRARGVTTVVTAETAGFFSQDIQVSVAGVSASADNIIVLRQVAVRSQRYHLVSILKLREGSCDPAVREYRMTPRGVEVAASSDSVDAILDDAARGRHAVRPPRARRRSR